MTPMPAKTEMETPLGTKIAAWGIVLMIIYLVIAQ